MADAKGLGSSPPTPTTYLDDDRLSLEAKGLLSIIVNYTYEQVMALNRSSDLARPLAELKRYGYIGRFAPDVFEVRLVPFRCEGGRHVV